MSALTAYRRGVRAAVAQPVVFAAAFLLIGLGSVPAAVQSVWPLAGGVLTVAVYVAFPFVIAGMLAVSADALEGSTSLETFVPAGKRTYKPMLIAMLLVAAFSGVAYFAAAIGGFFVLVPVLIVGDPSLTGTGLIWVGLLVLLALFLFLLMLVPMILCQFFAAAIVEDDASANEALRGSYRLVRANLGTVLTFDLVGFLVSLLIQIPNGFLLAVTWDDLIATAESAEAGGASTTVFTLLSTSELAIYLGGTVVLGTLVGGIMYPSYLALYRQLTA